MAPPQSPRKRAIPEYRSTTQNEQRVRHTKDSLDLLCLPHSLHQVVNSAVMNNMKNTIGHSEDVRISRILEHVGIYLYQQSETLAIEFDIICCSGYRTL